MINLEGCGGKWSWHIFKVPSQHLPWRKWEKQATEIKLLRMSRDVLD